MTEAERIIELEEVLRQISELPLGDHRAKKLAKSVLKTSAPVAATTQQAGPSE